MSRRWPHTRSQTEIRIGPASIYCISNERSPLPFDRRAVTQRRCDFHEFADLLRDPVLRDRSSPNHLLGGMANRKQQPSEFTLAARSGF
jgi:hypothetical protein